jgi:hypothetical protein
MNPAEQLWARHQPPKGYPAGVIPIPQPIDGTAFFPGGYGLWRPEISEPLPPFPTHGIMVLGHDFHSESGYRESLARGREAATQPTWRNLLAFMKAARIDPERCFFTNVYMGLRAGRLTTGEFPGARNAEYVEHCVAFLRQQIEAQQPSLILTLGINVPPLLGRLSAQLTDWTQRRGLPYLDEAGPVRFGARFDGTDVRSTVVALTHPSLRTASVRYRRYAGEVGHAAELLMLSEAMGGEVPRWNGTAWT